MAREMARCVGCAQEFGQVYLQRSDEGWLCERCAADRGLASPPRPRHVPDSDPSAADALRAFAPESAEASLSWREAFFVTIGILTLGAGFYILVVSPGVEVPGRPALGIEPREVVNLQKLYIGQTLAIIGAIFLAVGVRPR